MASRENLYNIGKNMGRLAVAGAALFVAAQQVDRSSHNPETNQIAVVRGQVLTEEEVTQIRNYDNFISVSAKIEPALPIEKYKAELPSILTKIGADAQETEDLRMYYPIYRAGQDKTGVPWYLIWIIHDEESTVSRNENAFIPGAAHYGAMQRAKEFHPDSDVERASKDYGYLTDLPQRHADDWREIVWGAEALSEYINNAGSTLGGLERYSAAGPAQDRYERYLRAENIFG